MSRGFQAAPEQSSSLPLTSAAISLMAKEAGFDQSGVARAAPIPSAVLGDWLASGMAADMDWMAARAAERLDPARVLPGARTVISLVSNYYREDPETAESPVARY